MHMTEKRKQDEAEIYDLCFVLFAYKDGYYSLTIGYFSEGAGTVTETLSPGRATISEDEAGEGTVAASEALSSEGRATISEGPAGEGTVADSTT